MACDELAGVCALCAPFCRGWQAFFPPRAFWIFVTPFTGHAELPASELDCCRLAESQFLPLVCLAGPARWPGTRGPCDSAGSPPGLRNGVNEPRPASGRHSQIHFLLAYPERRLKLWFGEDSLPAIAVGEMFGFQLREKEEGVTCGPC